MADFVARFVAPTVDRVDPDTVGARIMQFTEPGSEPSSGDTTSPVVTFVSPTPGSPIEKTGPLVVDVTDETALRVTLVLARYAGTTLYEVAWDGAAFAELYSSSSREAVAGGHRYTLRRTGGWPSSPTIRAVAVDTAGNEDAG